MALAVQEPIHAIGAELELGIDDTCGNEEGTEEKRQKRVRFEDDIEPPKFNPDSNSGKVNSSTDANGSYD